MNTQPTNPSTLTLFTTEALNHRFQLISQGFTDETQKIRFRGKVVAVKSPFESIPLFFRISETPETQSFLVRWIPNVEIEWNKPERETFSWVNDNIEQGCDVQVDGYLRHTFKGKFMIDALDVKIVAHPPWSEDLEETRESDENRCKEEEEYTLEEVDEPILEEEGGEEVMETRISGPSVRVSPDITLTPTLLVFHNREFSIKAFQTKPGRISLKTSLGEFHFDRMDDQFVSTMVPPSVFEPQFPHGYTTLAKLNFRSILQLLF